MSNFNSIIQEWSERRGAVPIMLRKIFKGEQVWSDGKVFHNDTISNGVWVATIFSSCEINAGDFADCLFINCTIKGGVFGHNYEEKSCLFSMCTIEERAFFGKVFLQSCELVGAPDICEDSIFADCLYTYTGPGVPYFTITTPGVKLNPLLLTSTF